MTAGQSVTVLGVLTTMVGPTVIACWLALLWWLERTRRL